MGMHAFDSINDRLGDLFVSKSGFINKFSNTTVHVGCDINLNHPDIGEDSLMYEPSGFDKLGSLLDEKFDDHRDEYKEMIDQFLKQEGVLAGGGYIKLAGEIENSEISSYEWDVRYDGEHPTESFEATAFTKHDFNPEALGISPQVLIQILDSRDWKLAIRSALIGPAQQEVGTEYHLDISNSSAAASGEDIEYIIEFSISADDPDARVELFREVVTGEMDDEDELNAVFNRILAQFMNSRMPAGVQQNLDTFQKVIFWECIMNLRRVILYLKR